MSAFVEIASDALTAAINPFGAELTHLRDSQGRELMTDADPAFWPHYAPILFPVIGMTNGGVIRLDGADYPMPKHGFARHSMFTVAERHEQRAVFSLAPSAETRRSYPFEFALSIAFELAGSTLSITATIGNPAPDRPLPAQFGFHPALAWPLPYGEPREAHRITFDADEPERLLRVGPDGLIAPERRDNPLDGRTLDLRDALFTDDALVFDPLHSDRVRYGAASGPALEVAFPDTPRLGIWTKPGAHFVCIEPWHGLADPEGFTGAFHDKPGVFEIAPGAEKRIVIGVTLIA